MTIKIYDCFTFYNELDILEIRLNELYEKVDYFVICEATQTFRGDFKPLIYAEHRNRFQDFEDKIIHVVVNDFPYTVNPWDREFFQRNAIRRGFNKLRAMDVVIISDVDEIIRGSVVENILRLKDGYFGIDMPMYQFFLNTCAIPEGWNRAYAYSYFLDDQVGDLNTGRQKPVETREAFFELGHQIVDGGWHFTFMGGAEAARQKLKAYSHSGGHYDEMMAEGAIEEKLNSAGGVGEGFITRLQEIDDRFPRFVRDNVEKYKKLGFIKSPIERLRELEYHFERSLFRISDLEKRHELLQSKINEITTGNDIIEG